MDYWQTIGRIKQDWGMGHPLADRENQRDIVQLIDDIGEHMNEEDAEWFEAQGLFVADGDGEVDIRKGGNIFRITTGPVGKVMANGKAIKPGKLHFTNEFYDELKRQVAVWATTV